MLLSFRNGSRPLKPEEEGIAGGFEAWTLWGEVSATMVSDSTYIPPYMDLTGPPFGVENSFPIGDHAAFLHLKDR